MNEADSASEKRAEEAAAIRRRWITLGEVLAVLAVAISALTLWLNWSQRRGEAVEKAAQSTRETARAATLVLGAAPEDRGARLAIRPVSPSQSVQSQTIRFPAAIGADPVETTGEPRIEARWFDAGLKKARNRAGLPDDSRGDERLPVLIETRFLVDGEAHDDIAVYDIGYTIRGQMLSGHQVTLRGLSLVKRIKGGAGADKAGPAALDARWNRLVPAKRD
ncbi:hypothetical protein G432_13890 [Sphingomonas sp. MM-1]|uniref:hypothetical protein n=1 Tax=Sphingomonas sp. MM-1 TaxID=745310 RepID=UPI0002C0F287|nr:hypothetical protein [Sphingomonas sp. MM-1]AGH50496.1 hypothetical protein G432_13890 [Sphingomonas sp. MM-1]